MVEHQLPKLNTRVRFPSPAPPQLSPGTILASMPRAVSTRAFAASAASRPRNGPSVTRCQVPSSVSARLDAGFESAEGERSAQPVRLPLVPERAHLNAVLAGAGGAHLRGWRPVLDRPDRREGPPTARSVKGYRRQGLNRLSGPPSGEGAGRSRSSSSAARSGSGLRPNRRPIRRASPEAPRGGPALRPRPRARPRGRGRIRPFRAKDGRADAFSPSSNALHGRRRVDPEEPSPSATTLRVASARVRRALLSSASSAGWYARCRSCGTRSRDRAGSGRPGAAAGDGGRLDDFRVPGQRLQQVELVAFGQTLDVSEVEPVPVRGFLRARFSTLAMRACAYCT